MKQFVVNYKIVVTLKFFHADGTTLKRSFRSSEIYYVFILVKPAINAVVVKNMQTRKHSAIVSIVQLF
jgi:hypothetical protein